MKDLHHSCQGESHILTGKVCQDVSFSLTTDTMSIAIVCDGHGGERYFRSDVGANYAVDVTKECVKSFVEEVDVDNIFSGKSFVQKSAITSEANSNIPTKDTIVDKTLRQLFSSIIYKWRNSIEQHSQLNPLTESEKQKINARFQEDFIKGIGIEKTYGCTLMCYISTPQYWFAFHIGDGKCISFDKEGNWHEPIPWDEKCFLNKTTSLCDSTAIDEFRYCYCGDGSFPLAVFLGSDGIDDSFGTTENMVNFYIQVLKLLANDGYEKAIITIQETLPQLSKIGSKDDMSVACIYDDISLPLNIKKFIAWQIGNVGNGIAKENERILKQQENISSIKAKGINSQKLMIDYQYAQKELVRAYECKRALVDKWNRLSHELHGDGYLPFEDEIGLGSELIDVVQHTENDYRQADDSIPENNINTQEIENQSNLSTDSQKEELK